MLRKREDMTQEDSPAEKTPRQLGEELFQELNKYVKHIDVEKALALIAAGADFEQEDALGNSARKMAQTRKQTRVVQRMDEMKLAEEFSKAIKLAAEEEKFLEATDCGRGLPRDMPATKPLISGVKAYPKC